MVKFAIVFVTYVKHLLQVFCRFDYQWKTLNIIFLQISLFTGRTTIIVAHRLSTIRSADKIVAIRDGIVREIGTHDALMQKEGLYHSLVMAQVGVIPCQ